MLGYSTFSVNEVLQYNKLKIICLLKEGNYEY